MSFTTLPSEILSKILDHLTKQDIQTISLVCKSWKDKISSYLGKFGDVKLKSCQFKNLNKDLARYPGFAAKVSKLTVTSNADTNQSLILRDIIKQCPNLLVLIFTNAQVYKYLRVLQSNEILLPNIRNIDVKHLKMCSPATNRFYIWINIKFKATVKSLEFVNIPSNGALAGLGGLVKYTSSFPHLTLIKIEGTHGCTELQLDLHELLTANTSLESITIRDNYRITGDIRVLEGSVDVEYPSLKKFCLFGGETDISFINYIMSRFTKLELSGFDDLGVSPNESLSDDTVIQILQEFQSFPTTVKNIFFAIEGYCFMSTHFAGNHCYLFDDIHEKFLEEFRCNGPHRELYDVQEWYKHMVSTRYLR